MINNAILNDKSRYPMPPPELQRYIANICINVISFKVKYSNFIETEEYIELESILISLLLNPHTYEGVHNAFVILL